MNTMIFREITPHSESVDRWNDVTINAGASQSTLQDIKLPECAGCFTYRNSGDLSSPCSNRFIYWRTNHDVIELVEISLDVTLRNNHLRLRFQNTPILRGVSIDENHDQVVLLVPTVSAIHKLVFPHPNILEQDSFHVGRKDLVLPSIFYDTSLASLRSRSCYFVLNHVSLGIPLPHTSCSWLDTDGNATFILANSAGSVLMVVMSDRNGVEIATTELMKTGSIFRLLNGLVPTSIRSTKTEVALSIVCHRDLNDTLIFALFSDLQIRVWSYRRQECILQDSVVNFDYEKLLTSGNFTAHQCHLRKSTDDSGNFYLGVYVPIPHKKLFFIFNPAFSYEPYKLRFSCMLQQESHDLVDFCVGRNRLWSLWLTCENQPVVLSAWLECDRKTEQQLCWMPVSVEPQVSRTVDYGSSNPQEAYLKEIFRVGRFLPSTINKAISIYNTNRNTSFSSSAPLKAEDLRNWVIEAVETEILRKTPDAETSESDYVEISAECWDRFFSYCIQYHEVGMKPLGISQDPNTGSVVIIKKNFYSLLCPCDSLEVFTNPDFRSSIFSVNLLDNEEKRLYHSLKAVLTSVDLVRKHIDDKLLMRFEDKLFNLISPIKYASELRKTLELEAGGDFYKNFQSMMPSNSDIVACLEFLLTKLDLSRAIQQDVEESFPTYSSFANSSSGIGALCAGLAHFARQRFEFCRDLLLFELVLYESDALECEQLDHLLTQSAIIPKTVNLLRSYYIILWCTQCECVPVSPAIQDAAFKQFCLLELPEFTDKDLTSIKRRQTISHLFFEEDGGVKARKILGMRHFSQVHADDWESLFPTLVYVAATLLWPLEENVIFPEFLFARCQHLPLQEYDRLLQGWCTENKQFINFLVAGSYLILGESHKAVKLFLEVSKEIEGESLLCRKILRGRYVAGTSITSSFCMRVIQMFEQFCLSTCIVRMASAAINEIEETDSHLPIFYSVLFKHHLNLGHSEEAFATLIKNPDSSRQKDCLRQLVVKLCEMKQFWKIIDLSYLAFEEEIINILESRSRCSDLCHNTSFYGILYALHIHHKKFRKAATVMYELAIRFGREVVSLKGLKKQVSCYLAAINCLHLVDPQHAWIVKPALSAPENSSSSDVDGKNLAKRNSDGVEIIHSNRPVKIEVLGLEDVMREYTLVQARLLHAQKYCNATNLVVTPLSAEETVALLLNAGLFDTAIQLSKAFSLSLVPVFEALAYKCLSSTLRSETHLSSTIDGDKYFKSCDPTIDYINQEIGRFQIWHQLEKYLVEYEEAGQSELHRCVTEKLLSHGATLPAWLKLSYQKRNFTELASLYISHGLLSESLTLIHKYIKAVLGVRKEDFNLKYSLHINSPPVWLPHTYIDILLDAVGDFQHDDTFQDTYLEFIETLKEYNKTVESITSSKLSESSTLFQN
ncbi:Nuclear pore complex protein Nup160 [Araneus ventricosus]|uniref:Nuclear pore complex protein Nup160 n=1 Tax=Araneus ventricosus TaxID=182803 RepID=A0A4Y2I5N2_ARAVE|nr:Nuclear pore complex protein Nup160 [Araneus ventricosus]